MGIRIKDGRIWLSYNGTFLNPPAPSERVLTEKEQKKKQAEIARMDPEEGNIFNETEPNIFLYSKRNQRKRGGLRKRSKEEKNKLKYGEEKNFSSSRHKWTLHFKFEHRWSSF